MQEEHQRQGTARAAASNKQKRQAPITKEPGRRGDRKKKHTKRENDVHLRQLAKQSTYVPGYLICRIFARISAKEFQIFHNEN
jgi:hypothetical protein